MVKDGQPGGIDVVLHTFSAEVTIGVVGKYLNPRESYKSLYEALIHGGIANHCRVNINFIHSEDLETDAQHKSMMNVDGILVPGGFGDRGIEGKINAIRYSRENKIPFFGICLGMQLAVVEISRDMAGLSDANSTEFDAATGSPVIYLMKEWFDYRSNMIQTRDEDSNLGGTMRLGAYPCRLVANTRAYAAYGQEEVFERHRHRFEFNTTFEDILANCGVVMSGRSPDGNLVEIIELKDHPWFLGCQFHPEFKSRPMEPHPLFKDFIKVSIEQRRAKNTSSPSVGH
ncbi:MAG: CTP synthase [Deltaproteobacteria bacterium]|nr:CTP synthase [Deltaproteobacteria bacterium]